MTIIDPASIRRLADMHAVYRMFDEAGRLLYVGISGRAGRRFDDHAMKRWFPLVSNITLEWHATPAEAALAERRAIAAERPRYNIAGKNLPSRQVVKVAPPLPSAVVILSDVLAVFKEDEKGLHLQVIAARLARQFPQRWDGATRQVVSAQCRALGVTVANVRKGPTVTSGCRRGDVERVMAQRVLREVG